MRAWESLFWFCAGVFPVLAAALGCVCDCREQQSRVENVGSTKHIIRVVSLYHKPSQKSLFQPAKEGEIPHHSWQGRVECLSLVSVFLSLL